MGLRLLLHSTHTSPDLAHRFMQGAVTMPNMPLYFTRSPTFIFQPHALLHHWYSLIVPHNHHIVSDTKGANINDNAH
jgi:hypothetical protein